MMIYLKNTAGYKMDFFKGMTYAQICPIFQVRFDENIRFLFKSREEMEARDQEIIKSKNKTPTQKAAQRRKLSEKAQEAEDLRKRLEVVEDEDDDVFVKATPLASKVPVVDYHIVLIENKPRFKIIRADETHQFYISFATLLKNFDRKDLETLLRIVKDRFSTSKPTNFSDEYLLLTLRTMFKELDGQVAIWTNQKSVHGLALVKRWKLMASCGVHVITLSTIQLFLLVKRRKLSEEAQEAEDLRKRLEVVEDEDDDVFVDATPLAQKVPVVDYQIVLVDNKPRFKIIRADESHQFYISFTTLLKNFNREDLETLWRIVKDRFSTSKPTNFFDEYLLLTLKTMFEEPDGQDAIWRNQKSVHGLVLVKRWKLLTSCGVHVITLSTVQLFLLVERRYPLSRFTLEQLVNVTRLQVEEESEMSLELLRFTRQQL
nr:hypothetical protein [Tanacetum cinerariifolium]